MNQSFYAIVNKFGLGAHVREMQNKHPQNSVAQNECCLYWQPKARKQLTSTILEFMKEFADYTICVAYYKGCPQSNKIIYSPPEAMGIEVTKTLLPVGIELEWPPKEYAYQVAIAGIRKAKKIKIIKRIDSQ